MKTIVSQSQNLSGQRSLPGDKSISHRAAILGALSTGITKVENYAPGEDCTSTLDCLRKLSTEVQKEKTTVTINGGPDLLEPDGVLDAGNSGTTARLLMGVLAGANLFACITGDDSLKKRPMDRVIKPLSQMGKQLFGRNNNTQLPVAIVPSKADNNTAFNIHTKVASAQVKSAIILAGLFSPVDITITEPQMTRDHTERMISHFGSWVTNEMTPQGSHQIHLPREQIRKLSGGHLTIPGDISSAAFLIAAGLLVPDSQITLTDVGLNPTRTGFLELIAQMGGTVTTTNTSNTSEENRGDLTVEYTSKLNPVTVGKDMVPNTIDELPLLAVKGVQRWYLGPCPYQPSQGLT